MELKRIGVMSTAKVCALLGVIIGFIYGIIFAAIGSIVGSLIGAAAGVAGMDGLWLGLGLLSIIAFPIFFAIGGFICGAIWAFLYNVAAKYVGGVQLDLK